MYSTNGPLQLLSDKFNHAEPAEIKRLLELAKPALGGSGMNDTNPAIDKLQRIRELWVELGRTGLSTPEYSPLRTRFVSCPLNTRCWLARRRSPKSQ
jgi:hypothetical protein